VLKWTSLNKRGLRIQFGSPCELFVIKGRKVNWIGHIWPRNCFLKHVIEGIIEGRKLWEYDGKDVSSFWMTVRKQRGYCRLKEEAIDRTVWRTRFGRENGLVVRQTTE
jgi:hypothetical protein